MHIPRITWRYLVYFALAGAMTVAVGVACGGETETVTEVQTVVVEKQVTTVERVVETVVVEKQVTEIEKVIETVVVEKTVEGKTVMVVETVVVEKPVTRTEKVVETVIVEKPVTRTEKVVETVVVEKQVTQIEKVVETVVVEKVVVATPEAMEPGVVPSTWGGTLRLAAHGPGNHNDPFWGGSIVITGVFSPMYNKLVRHSGITSALPIVPDLAQSWELSDDGLDYTFFLRQGVKFHDGSDFDAEDAVASFNRHVYPAEGLVAGAGGNFGSVTEINQLDQYTIEIKQNAPKVPIEAFAHGNAIISTKEVLEETGGDLRERECCAPGTGPFMHAGGVRNDERWVQERWDGYWKPGEPHPDFLEHIWLIYQTPENDAAVKSGIVDWAAWVTPGLNEEVEAGEGPPGLIAHGWIFPVVGAYIFNTRHDLFSDKRVRKAFALVIDQNDIFVALAEVEAHQPGGFLPVNTAHAKPLSELMTIPGVRPTTDEDVAEAQALMAAAGYPNGEGFPEVELLSRDSPSERIPNEAIQAMLKSRLNVDSRIKLLDSATHGEALVAEQYDFATLGPYSTGLADPVGILESGYLCDADGNDRRGNPIRGGWCNEEIQPLIADMALTKSGSAARQALVDQVNDLLYDEWPRIPTGPYPQFWAHWDYLGGNLPRTAFTGHYVLFTWDDVWLNLPERRAETR